jgi:hypothetical protein
MKVFGWRHFGEGRLEGRPTSRPVTPGLGQLHQISPLVAARSEPSEELIDPNGVTAASLRHLIFFLTHETASPHYCLALSGVTRFAAPLFAALTRASRAHRLRQSCAQASFSRCEAAPIMAIT